MSDHPLELQIMQALARNPRVHAEEIAVQALEGEVLLRGTVGGLAQRTEAERTTRGVPGVLRVEDRLRVRPLGFDERADAETAAAVLAALIDDYELRAAGIDVKAKAGDVTLSGRVELASERDRAERVARRVGGVEHVSNRRDVSPAVSAHDS